MHFGVCYLHPDRVVFMRLCVGFLVTHHYEFMLHKQLRDPYHHLLMHEDVPTRMCCQVLRNLQTYLVEEELKMMKADAECMFVFVCLNSA